MSIILTNPDNPIISWHWQNANVIMHSCFFTQSLNTKTSPPVNTEKNPSQRGVKRITKKFSSNTLIFLCGSVVGGIQLIYNSVPNLQDKSVTLTETEDLFWRSTAVTAFLDLHKNQKKIQYFPAGVAKCWCCTDAPGKTKHQHSNGVLKIQMRPSHVCNNADVYIYIITNTS